MSDTTPTPITSEEQFRELSGALATELKSTHAHERFDELAHHVQESLRVQDSDRALILITK